MKITLDSNPSDAPGCLKIVAEDGRDILIQTDWDLPGVASTFGWPCPKCDTNASFFIQCAREWLDENDGAQAEDPGYFN